MRSIFGEILTDLLDALPAAHGAIFADWEGEEVDHATRIGLHEMRLVGAHWGVVFFLIRKAFHRLDFGGANELILRFSRQQIIVSSVTDAYFVAVVTPPDASLGRALAAIEDIRGRLREEM